MRKTKRGKRGNFCDTVCFNCARYTVSTVCTCALVCACFEIVPVSRCITRFQIKTKLRCFDRPSPCFEREEIFEETLPPLSSAEKFSRREHFNCGISWRRKKGKNPNTRGSDLKHSWLSIRLRTERKSAVPAVITHVHNEPRIVQTFFYHSNALITVQPVKLYKIRIEKKT